MVKRLGLVVLLSLIAFPSLAQGLSGSWTAEVTILPSVGFSSSTLSLSGELSGWTISGTGYWLGTDGWVWQELGVKGNLLDMADLEWTLLFGPLAPAFLYSLGTVEFSYENTNFTVYVATVGPNVPGYFFSGGPSGGMVILAETEFDGIGFASETGFGARLSQFTITYTGANTYTKTYPVDPFPGGLQFTYQQLSLSGITLCCGISLEASLAFTKEAGFDHLTITAYDLISPCCGISIGLSVTFYPDAKELSLLPSWEGIEGCFTLYGDVNTREGLIEGIEIHGFKLACEFGDCNRVEILTALSVAEVEGVVGDVFQGDEFEYIKLSFCGPACCGGSYTLEAAAYFQESGPLFGLSRLTVEASFPLAENAALSLSFSAPTGGDPSLSLGWSISF